MISTTRLPRIVYRSSCTNQLSTVSRITSYRPRSIRSSSNIPRWAKKWFSRPSLKPCRSKTSSKRFQSSQVLINSVSVKSRIMPILPLLSKRIQTSNVHCSLITLNKSSNWQLHSFPSKFRSILSRTWSIQFWASKLLQSRPLHRLVLTQPRKTWMQKQKYLRAAPK